MAEETESYERKLVAYAEHRRQQHLFDIKATHCAMARRDATHPAIAGMWQRQFLEAKRQSEWHRDAADNMEQNWRHPQEER